MLNQFIFQNYRIFQNETLLDFFPAPINEHKRSLLTAPGDQETFLPVIALYGPNGCGKSSVLEALGDCADLWTRTALSFSPAPAAAAVWIRKQQKSQFPLTCFSEMEASFSDTSFRF